MKNYLAIAVLTFAPLLAQAAEVSSTEQAIIAASTKRAQEIAVARIPIETKYLNFLQESYKKAESAKDLDLQIRIKKEIELTEGNIAYYKAKSTESGSHNKSIYGVKFYQSDKVTNVRFERNGKYFVNTNYATGKYVATGNVIKASSGQIIAGVDSYTYDEDKDCFIASNGNAANNLYREGSAALGGKEKEVLKAPEGEEINTVFGRRVK